MRRRFSFEAILSPHLLANVARDVRHELRALRHTPVFTTVAILTFALGIGAK